MPRPISPPTSPPSDHEYERLNPGAHADPPQPKARPKEDRSKGEADLPGSQNADLRGAKRDRTFRGSTT